MIAPSGSSRVPGPRARTSAGALRPGLALGGVALVLGIVLLPRLLAPAPAAEAPEEASVAQPAQAPVRPKQGQAPAVPLVAPGAVQGKRPLHPIAGRIVDDATDEPVQRFVLKALPGPPPADPAAWEDCFTQNNQSEDGGFGLYFLEPGTYTLRVQATGFADFVLEGLQNPSPEPFLEVRMLHGRWIHGTVRDPLGGAVADFPLQIVPVDTGRGVDRRQPLETRSAEDGSYHFSDLPQGRWRMELAGLAGVLREVPVAGEWTPEEGQEIVWDPVLPELTTVELDVKYKAKRFVFARVEASLRTPWGGALVEPLLNDTARFSFVPPGTYELTIARQGDDQVWYSEFVQIEAGEPLVALAREVTPPARERPKIEVPPAKKGAGKGKPRPGKGAERPKDGRRGG